MKRRLGLWEMRVGQCFSGCVQDGLLNMGVSMAEHNLGGHRYTYVKFMHQT